MIWRRGKTVCFLLSLVFWFFGQLESSTCFAARPLITEDTETVEKGFFELELGFDHLRDDDRDKYYLPSIQLKYGPTEKMEIGASLGYIFKEAHEEEQVDGWSDAIVYLKYRLWEEGKYLPAFALKPLIKLPTARAKKDLGSGKADYALGAIVDKSLRDVILHFDFSYSLIGDKGKTDFFNTGLAFEYEFLKSWTAVAEARYSNNFNSDRQDDPAHLSFGIKKEVGPAVFDAAVSVGLNNAAADYGFTIGVTLKFK